MTLSLLAHEELLRAESELRRELAEARAEIAQLQTDEEQLRREMNMLIEGAFAADARAEEAHAALDAAKVPRQHDGRALALAERIVAALPPLPEPAGEWRRAGVRRPWWGRVLVGHADATGAVSRGLRVRVFVDGDAWSIDLDGRTYDRAAAQDLLVGLRLALGPAGIPPTNAQRD